MNGRLKSWRSSWRMKRMGSGSRQLRQVSSIGESARAPLAGICRLWNDSWRHRGVLYAVSEHVIRPYTFRQVVANLERLLKSLVLVQPAG